MSLLTVAALGQSHSRSRGFAFLAYEDQRSTVLAVDNFNGARVAGRTVRVEHVDNYRRKKAEARLCVCMRVYKGGRAQVHE
jgi:RNA recognition motif-containing protein